MIFCTAASILGQSTRTNSFSHSKDSLLRPGLERKGSLFWCRRWDLHQKKEKKRGGNIWLRRFLKSTSFFVELCHSARGFEHYSSFQRLAYPCHSLLHTDLPLRLSVLPGCCWCTGRIGRHAHRFRRSFVTTTQGTAGLIFIWRNVMTCCWWMLIKCPILAYPWFGKQMIQLLGGHNWPLKEYITNLNHQGTIGSKNQSASKKHIQVRSLN